MNTRIGGFGIEIFRGRERERERERDSRSINLLYVDDIVLCSELGEEGNKD